MYICAFFTEKTYFTSQDPNEMKSKITSKTKRKLKVNPDPNYATFMIEFCLFISLG